MSPFSDDLYPGSGCCTVAQRPRRARALWLLLATLLVPIVRVPGAHADAGIEAGATVASRRAESRQDRESVIDPRLAPVKAAFLRHDAAELARLFPDNDRVHVALPHFGVDGFLGPGPLRALLDRLVRETRIRSFAFLPSDDPPAAAGGDRLYAKARWTYVDTATGTAREDRLYLALRQVSGDAEWRIVELKATR